VIAIEKLTESLESGRGRSLATRPSDSRGKAPGYASLDVMWERVLQLLRSGAPSARDELTKELTRVHMLWTPDDVVERYGPPGSVAGGEAGICLVFGNELEPGKPVAVYFDIHAGVVTSVRGP
jgi:hypothetical protein